MLPAWSMWISGSPTSRCGSEGTLADHLMPPVPLLLNLVAPSAPGRVTKVAATGTTAKATRATRRTARNFMERPPTEDRKWMVSVSGTFDAGASTPAPTLEAATGYADVETVNEFERLMTELYDDGVVEEVIRPAAVLPEEAARLVLVEMSLRNIDAGGLWDANPTTWHRYDRPRDPSDATPMEQT